ncbi:flavin reductase [Amphritea sp.]|uniref:flavin reductase n=1 Tax=Amphritea sp. TaxID=1872502 RepID=UPI003A8EB894
MSMQNLDIRDFRRALSQFPTGVTVITTRDEQGEPVGVTASSFNSVSIDPPLILWSIDKGAHSLATFENTEFFAVNVLSRDQVETSNRFASRGEDKFKDVEYTQGVGDSPLLSDYSAQFECKTWAVYEGGDHLILVGEVIDYRYRDSNLPLVFTRGSYSVSSQHPSTVTYEKPDQSGAFISDYLLYMLRESYNRFSADLYPLLQAKGDVNPEEWRILAMVRDRGAITLEALAPIVMQPEVALLQTIDWMVDKGLVQLQDNTLALLPEGRRRADELLALAKQHEAQVLMGLSEEQSLQLKNGLKVIMASHA